MTNSIEEILGADLLFVIGSNATEAHPIIGNKMKQAVKAGTKLIVADPRETELAKMADIWLQLKPGSDIALINGLMNIIINNNWQDQEYIDNLCEGYDELKAVVSNYTPEYASEISGISVDVLYEAAKLYSHSPKAGIFYTLGITEHICGTDNVSSLANLGMITGHIGKESCGINPIRGQNNVQGACDMGALPDVYPAYQKVNNPDVHKFFEEKWNAKLSDKFGLKIPEMFDKAVSGEVKAMYVMGEDPILSDPNANHVKKAFESMDFVIVQDIFMSETAKYADVVLPAACYAEKDGTFTNTERRVQRVRKAVEAPGEAKDDWAIICEIAKAMGLEGFDFNNAEEIFEDMRIVTPSYRGMNYKRIDKIGLQWPCPTEDHPGTKFLHKGKFTRGKGLIRGIEYRKPFELPDDEYPMLLSTGRMIYHYNVTTRFSESLDRVRPYELAEINPYDAEQLGIKELDLVKVTSRRGEIVTRVTVTDRVQKGMLWMTLHYKESPVNELTVEAVDPVTGTGEYKVCAIKVEKVERDDNSTDFEYGKERFVNLKNFVINDVKFKK